MKFARVSGTLTVLILVVLICGLAMWPQPAMAQDATTPAILRHEPGRPARVNDLDVRLAAGEIADPLGPNTTLIYWDKISMVFQSEDNKFTHKTYDVDANLSALTAKERTGLLGVNGGGNMSIASGYFGGAAGWMDSVAAWEYPTGRISVYVESYNSALSMSKEATHNSTDAVVGARSGWPMYGGKIRVATGDFDGDGYDEFVVAWEGAGASLNLRAYDVNSSTFVPTPKGAVAGEMLGSYKFLNVATGDLNRDGKDEVVLAWQGSDGKLAIKVLSVSADGTPTTQVKLVETAATPGQIAVTTGDFDGDLADEIAVAFNTKSNANVYLYEVSEDLKTLTKKGTVSPLAGVPGNYDNMEMAGRQLGLQAGDFSADGIDELALVYGAPSKWRCNVSVYSTDAALVPTIRSGLYVNWLGCYGDLSLAVGDMNRDTIDEIVVASPFGAELSGNDIDIGVFQVAPDLSAITQKIVSEDSDNVGETNNYWGHMAIAVGAFDGKSARVGPPTYTHMDETLQVLAVINAPPKHEDEVDGVVYDVNVTDRCRIPPCTYASYETEEKTSTSMSVATNRDWSVSGEAKLKFGHHLEASMKASYGESFEKTTTSFSTREFGQNVKANEDDAIVRVVQSLNVWEYPVYADGTDEVQGHILVVWPDKTDPACTSNCAAAITQVVAGESPTSYYLPNHEVENALSYSMVAPTDISTTIKSDVMTDLSTNEYEMWVKWSDVQEDETKQSNKLDLDASLEVSGFGQSLTTSGSYSQGETTVNKVSFEQSTEIHLYFYGIELKYSYGVRPFIYWAKPDGHLVLDYQVEPVTASPPTWWQTTYDLADPALNLPWADGAMGPAYTRLSKEITFTPQSPTPGTNVTISAKVRNYSLVGAYNVPVAFYLGDPDQGGSYIGTAYIATLNPMSFGIASTQFSTAGRAAGEVLDIYAVANPFRTISEMTEENNKAYAQLPIASTAGGIEPGALSVSSDDIVLDPSTLSACDRVTISATVHAANKSFTWVAVEFWDGNPLEGGKFIGGRLVPSIVAGEDAAVSVDWATPCRVGEREVWVTVLRHPGDLDVNDNRAYQTVQLEPRQVSLPVVNRH